MLRRFLFDSPCSRKSILRRQKSLAPAVEAMEAKTLLSGIELTAVGTYETGIFDDSGAEIVAYDPDTQQAYYTNAADNTIGILDISDPTNPTQIGVIDMDAYGAGINSVAVSRGTVAAAVESDPKTDPGVVVFFDTSGAFLNQVTVGALPDMLTFTPDGSKVLVAGEGEPLDNENPVIGPSNPDPKGTVSIIDLSSGVASATVTIIDFTAFDGREADLRVDGVRIFPGRSASDDLEPEYVAVSPDNSTAFVTLQEANAFAIVDIASATVSGIQPLGVSDHSRGLPGVTNFDFTDLPELGTTATGETINLGGFSGLWFDGVDAETGNYKFLTVPDRGPNGDVTDGQRPFLLPDYQARIVSFELNPGTGQITVTGQTLLTRRADQDVASMMSALETGTTVDTLFTVGQTIPGEDGGYTPPGILDGLGAYELNETTVRVLANHELTSGAGYSYTLANGTELTGSRVSFFDIDKHTRQIVNSGLAYDTIIYADGLEVTADTRLTGDSSLAFEGIARLCSAMFVQGGTYNYVDDIFFTGEEDSGANGGLGGYEYALDVAEGTLYALPSLGYAAWENVTPLETGNPDKTALLIGDDRGGAPLYLWVGNKGLDAAGDPADDFLARNGLANGTLYFWKADSGETTPDQFNGTGESRMGTWEIMTDLSSIAAQDQVILDNDGFRFSRPEDVATDPTDGTRAVLASTGRGGLFPSDNWGITYIVDVDFDASGTPTTATLDIIYDGDDAGDGQFAGPDFGLRSPDNLDWADDGFIYIQEDRSTRPSSLFGGTSGEEASIWKLDPETGELTRIAQIDRSAVPEGQTDIDPTDLGDWESSGILDVSELFGVAPGSLLLFDVQAHSLRGGPIDSENLVEGGQLAFLATGYTAPTTLPITGLPNVPGVDEVPVDAVGDRVGYDAFGADLEGIVRAPDGTFWSVDEYRPAIYHFDTDGTLIDRFVPEGTAAQSGDAAGKYGTETLPSDYLNRRPNRGFEGMALDTDEGILYAFIQTPLSNPDRASGNASSVIRMLGIDPTTGAPVAEYVYLLQKPDVGGNVDKIGDAVYAGDGKFYVMERDSSLEPTAQKFVFQVDLKGASDVLGADFGLETLEQQTPDDLAALGIVPVNKIKVANLPSLGYLPSDKPEGLALLDDGRLAVLNDNDFALVPGAEAIQLGIIDFVAGNGIDASDRDDAINIQNWPVFGMYMPDAVTSFDIGGQTFYITANEGDSRDFDESRVKDLTLDPDAFPDAAWLQEDENLGRLAVSNIDGDLDGDGDYDQLFSYGSRSFTIWDSNGNLVFDSGDQFEQITAAAYPENFNSDNDENDFDSRSDAKGPEPEAVTTGVINGRTYAFVGLERIGGIMVYDVTDPTAPVFQQYINNRDFAGDPEAGTAGDLGVEDLKFVSAEDSPNGVPLLISANEVSGTVTIFQLSGAILNDGLLQIIGTESDDVAKVEYEDGTVFLYTNFLSPAVQEFDAADVISINIATLGGDDDIKVVNSLRVPTILDGGEGNDRVSGGGGRDIIIGGLGRDDLKGHSDDDILIAGIFETDGRAQALQDALEIWKQTDVDYATRVALLQDQYFNSETVLDDGDKDVLKGQNGSDWYLANLSQDRVLTGKIGEVFTDIASELLGFEDAGHKGKGKAKGRK